MPPVEICITLLVLLVVIISLTFFRVGPEMVLLGGLTVLLVADVIDTKQALSGFANEGLMTVAVLFVVAEGHEANGRAFQHWAILIGNAQIAAVGSNADFDSLRNYERGAQ